ncbi:hypothetical protein CK203_077618 [Vitis vinifera]|uniref:Reverse transcriptase domain-containing protein n=1 Tax=Vitis vinifera TaxID=29760 RepID=A0A438ETU4_VITVI|nr:hypothetical protein CK203_077618 [Vitis vinifera]
MWLIHFGSKDNLGCWWNECQFEGYKGHKFMKKLQFVKSKLKEWNKVSFVLANRLKKVLGKVVFVDQNAFVRDRQILDASLIANEVIDFWHKRLAQDGLWISMDGVDLVVHFNCKIFCYGQRGANKLFFQFKGLRQGDPLSPYLFVLGMEVLSALIRKVIDGGFISDCRIQGRGGMEMNVSHLLFVDDTIIFCEARKEHLTSLSWILAWFEAASGIRINLAKSKLIKVGEVEDIEEMTVKLGCRVGSLPTVYLGLPLGAHHKALPMWDGVEERMRRRLALWKRQYMSKGGRITLIKRGSLERKIHLINWDVVCTQKEKGCLGIRKIDLLNKALLEGFGWRTNEAHGTFGVGVWKEILKEANWCWDNIGFKVGEGTKVKFWTDHWCGNAALSQNFPQLFALAVHRNATVNEVWDSSLGQGGWNLRFFRDSNDWELDLIGEDAYNLLAAPSAIAFSKKSIWVDKVPTKVAFFAWEATWEKILTLDRLQKRGWHLPNRCFCVAVKRKILALIGAQGKKTRVKWIREEDCNSKFFHKVANSRWNRKFIKSLVSEDGVVLDNIESILKEIKHYFGKLFSKPLGGSWRIEDLDWSPISADSVEWLDHLFSEEEIHNAMLHLNKEKTLGLNGFTIGFYQECWETIKADLLRVFFEFHNNGIIKQSMNATFIALVLKKSQTSRISDPQLCCRLCGEKGMLGFSRTLGRHQR